MADVESAESHKKGGAKKARGKKKSTKIDMTPMVDLGFLLITFFILTTTLSEPTAMNLVVPAKEDKQKEESETKVGDEQALTVLLGANDKIFYYEGLLDPNKEMGLEEASWSSRAQNSIREVFIEKSRELNPRYDQLPQLEQQLKSKQISEDEYKEKRKEIVGYKKGIVVIIKASPESTYDNMVHVLDELNIANVGIKAIVEITPQELEMLKSMQ